MIEVAENVFCCEGTAVNWIILRDGRDLTLIDGGWPGDAPAVEESIRSLGCRPEDVQAMLLTHAHVDHMGALKDLHRRYGIPVYTGEVEVRHARREFLEQATVEDVQKAPQELLLPWLERVLNVGALDDPTIPDATPIPPGPLDLPGAPVAVPAPGHTTGHLAFHLPGSAALVTGDALVTGHALSPIDGPQLIPWFFTHEEEQAHATLAVFEALDVDLILPGHGRPANLAIAEAVAIARRNAAQAAAERGLD
ncbi:MBL fold metallo-hydrolase [Kitasatospora sp. RB6PN24]|uniref:MBL fold metallo-hydrolase n=1 Tax=Kitasatospora humi TaxID=2893891 RepID=UPI001E3D89F3|nr:MBL fold metallo-hydrolase [Kitasatospora humi]MCC9307857.1 MBL fold metallo-hydrolase [Kitasatospora humi]